jgi:hypothetical protein
MNELVSPYVGYRTDEFRGIGEGNEDLLEVTRHEMTELGNQDIPFTLLHRGAIKSTNGVNDYLFQLYKQGYKKCVWLCDSMEHLVSRYFDPPEKPEVVTRWAFSPGQWKIISDLQDEGKLIAYQGKPLVDEVPVPR